jgi:BexC/CtrB/KpsE family polysaccharide export inner-membrane protein
MDDRAIGGAPTSLGRSAATGERLWDGLLARTGARRLPWAFLLMVALPTLVTALYMFFIAAPVYVSEARFVVRSRNHEGPSAVGTVLQSVGVSLPSGETDAYEVHEYMMSRDAVADLADNHHLREILARPEADFLARFPRPFEGDNTENLYENYQRFVSVGYDSTTGISTLRVSAFRPQDAQALANALLNGGERLVNELNRRSAADTIDQAAQQVTEAQGRAQRAETALTEFRSRERLIDPTRASAAGADLVAQLEAQIINLEAERNSLAALAPQSPELATLDQKIRAYEAQRDAERTRVAGESDSLAPKIGEYERLMLDRDFSAKSLAAADAALEDAQIEARRKQTYLERVVLADRPDKAELPKRLFTVAMVLVSLLIAYATLVMVVAGLREHRQA